VRRDAHGEGSGPSTLGTGRESTAAYVAALEAAVQAALRRGASAVLVAPPGLTAADAGFDLAGSRPDRRASARGFGRDAGAIPVGAGGPLAVRVADDPGWCQAGPEQRRETAEALRRECGDDFFALHLAALAAEGTERHSLATRAAALATERRDELRDGKDAGAVRFGEEALAAAIAAGMSPP